jgi:leucyl aminopeptidase
LFLIPCQKKKATIYAGLGEKKECADHIVRSTAATAIQKALDLKRDHVSLYLGDINPEYHHSALEGAILGTYAFSKYQKEKPHQIKEIQLISGSLSKKDISNIQVICNAVFFARDLVNDNASITTPEYLSTVARNIAKDGHFSITILRKKKLQSEGLGLLSAVGQGSATPPRLIMIEYKGDPQSSQKLALVGKGITFDTGGINLKPSGNIETMREDMAGAAVVLGVMKALATLRPKANVIGVCPAACNALSGGSYFPGDVYRSFSGKTVEVCNTDAEGRLILADAISYCISKCAPTSIIDLATLTGAIQTTFANVVAGIFSNDKSIADGLIASGARVHERLWQLPVYKEYSDSMKGDHSDLRSLPKWKRGHGSSICGAAFIQEFVGTIPWAHLDIAGTSFNENEAKAEIPKYATGFGVRLLLDLIMNTGNDMSRKPTASG